MRHYKELLEQYIDYVKIDPFAMPEVEDMEPDIDMEYEEDFEEFF